MGMIYKRRYKRKDGTMAESAVWWIKYYRNGVPMRESAETDKETVARSLLRQREGDIERGLPITPQTNRCTVGQLLDDVLNDYTVNCKRSLVTVTYYIERNVRPYFGDRRAVSVTTADIRAMGYPFNRSFRFV
ncbi:MAG: hypothetical protein LAO09_23680 [Acidobacteriia bacterium]|nr:hypothetical protein [Terriglobia bacterium]